MEPAPLLLLLLSLLWGSSGRPADKLVVMPRQPVVRYGGSAQLNCSLACPGGTVQWKGLDTNLGSITSFPTHSILQVSGAAVATAGTKVCQGTCRGQHYQQTVYLKVYALPDRLQLDAEPPALEPGQPTSLRCAAQRVYPLTGLALTWYRGEQALEVTDFDVTETDEELFDIVSRLPVAGKDVVEGMEFRCEVTLSVGQETFTRTASVAASARARTEQPVAVATSAGSPWIDVATTESPSPARPMTTTALPPEPSVSAGDPPTAQDPGAETILQPAAATEPPLRRAPRSPASRRRRGRPQTGGGGDGGVRGDGASPQIRSLPPNGKRGRALRIQGRARCTGNATVRWLRTLSQYREEAAGSRSTLRLDHAETQHQGRYRCILLGRRSRLELRVSEDPDSAGPAIAAGTTVSLLGLTVTGVVSHRLWKRFRSRYQLA
ncbi:MADCA protein, partial [Rhinoptilus africanus]|nr:MADCA protein [Rhinoptilus africanus]